MRRTIALLFIIGSFILTGCGTKQATNKPPTECKAGDVAQCVTQCQSTGKKVCASTGFFGLCNPPMEVCNGKDDDCDGQIDDGLSNCNTSNNCTNGQTQQCVTPCSTVGSQMCVGGQWAQCTPPQEVCDGVDNDCDSQVDEGIQIACNNTCGAGFQTCVNGQMSQCSAPTPTPETCDLLDNDCDGAIDEGEVAGQLLKALCPLGGAFRTCVNGQWKTDTEVCDGVDNDCDGLVDNNVPGGCSCVVGETKQCGITVGICKPGVQECIQGKWTECGGNGFVGPTAETCDGLDNDCNNIVDDLPTGNQLACGSVECGIGLQQCSGGKMICVGGVDIVNDPYEPNASCNQGKQINIQEELGVQTITANVAAGGDVDWFKVTASEKGGLFSGCDTSKPEKFRFTITLEPPGNLDLDLCVFPANTNSCNALPASGTCENLPCLAGKGTCKANGVGIYSGQAGGVETYVHEWEGKCGGATTDKMGYYVKVVSYDGGDQCSTYTVSSQLTSWQSSGCEPNCGNKVCGNDGCGGSCGTCGFNQTCNSSGQCVSSCTPNCGGKNCGDDGCGGSCGTCGFSQTCNSSGQCVSSCTPNCAGKNCGDDGCGGSCGTCPAGQSCSAGQCKTTSGQSCGNVLSKGVCVGTQLKQCSNGTVIQSECSTGPPPIGDGACVYTPSTGKYGCVSQAPYCAPSCPTNQRCQYDGTCGCDGIDIFGHCENETMVYCSGTSLTIQDCTATNKKCVFDGDWAMCE